MQKSLELLRHRGPNATGLWVDPKKKASLGHTRLSIIDIDAGNQPHQFLETKKHAFFI